MSVRVVYCALFGTRRGFRGGRFAARLVSGEISAGGGGFWHCGDVFPFPFCSFSFVFKEVKEGRKRLWVWIVEAEALRWEETLKALNVSQRGSLECNPMTQRAPPETRLPGFRIN